MISAVQEYIKGYTGLAAGKPVWVNHLGPAVGEMSVDPQPGARIIERYLNGGSLREFPFAISLSVSTAADLERLRNNEVFESLSDWFEQQTAGEILPTLGTKEKALSIETTTWAYLVEQGQSDTGIYQVMCKLTYERQP